MNFTDTLTLDAPKITRDGFLAVRAKAARAGVYDYLASEVGGESHGFKATDTVKVYRPESEVFDTKSVGSFFAKPVTDNHPIETVTSDNWKKYARGAVMGAMRDGEYLAFDLVLMDADIIQAVDSGKRELSNGYSCQLTFGDGVAPDGTAYNATQSNIIGNHIAVVDQGRAGHECRIGDGGGNKFAVCDANVEAVNDISKNEGIKMKITLDGVSVTLTDASEVQAAFDNKASQLVAKDAEIAAAKTESVKLAADAVSKDAEIVALKAQLADAAITPDRLRDAAKAFADVSAKAKALGVTVTDAMDDAAIKQAAVTLKMGDAAKDYTADHIAVAFDVLAKDAKVSDATIVAISAPKGQLTDAAKELNALNTANDFNAWRNQA
jgi:uncharacterized protein